MVVICPSNPLISLDFSGVPEMRSDGPGGLKDVIFQLLSAGPGPERNPLISHGFFLLDL